MTSSFIKLAVQEGAVDMSLLPTSIKLDLHLIANRNC